MKQVVTFLIGALLLASCNKQKQSSHIWNIIGTGGTTTVFIDGNQVAATSTDTFSFSSETNPVYGHAGAIPSYTVNQGNRITVEVSGNPVFMKAQIGYLDGAVLAADSCSSCTPASNPTLVLDYVVTQ